MQYVTAASRCCTWPVRVGRPADRTSAPSPKQNRNRGQGREEGKEKHGGRAVREGRDVQLEFRHVYTHRLCQGHKYRHGGTDTGRLRRRHSRRPSAAPPLKERTFWVDGRRYGKDLVHSQELANTNTIERKPAVGRRYATHTRIDVYATGTKRNIHAYMQT